MPDFEKLCRWIPPEERDSATQKQAELVAADLPLLTVCGQPIRDTGRGKVVLLHNYLAQANGGRFPVNRQTIGDCVSHGYAKGIEVLTAVEILMHGEPEKWPGDLVATEWLYGTGRVLVGGGRLGNGDGSIGSWQAKAVKEHGTLHRRRYEGVDLTEYSGRRAKSWGYRGLPTELETIADEHPVTQTALVRSYAEARDAIANGYPIPVCSNQGFDDRRDADGFARPRGRWSHCMLFCAVDDGFRRPGLLCMNSWGPNWISGPKRHDQPDGSFWVDAETADRMLRRGDSYALAGYEGFEKRNIWELF